MTSAIFNWIINEQILSRARLQQTVVGTHTHTHAPMQNPRSYNKKKRNTDMVPGSTYIFGHDKLVAPTINISRINNTSNSSVSCGSCHSRWQSCREWSFNSATTWAFLAPFSACLAVNSAYPIFQNAGKTTVMKPARLVSKSGTSSGQRAKRDPNVGMKKVRKNGEHLPPAIRCPQVETNKQTKKIKQNLKQHCRRLLMLRVKNVIQNNLMRQ